MNIDYKRLFQNSPGAYLILSPNFTIVEVSEAYLEATLTHREEIIGRNVFEVFPDNPSNPNANGVTNLKNSLERVVNEHTVQSMDIQRYDIQLPAEQGDGFEERYWNPKNFPILDEHGRLLYILHCVDDVTELVHLHQTIDDQNKLPRELRTSRGDLAAVIVDEMYQFVALLDKDGRLLEVNRPALEGTGLKMSDVRGEFMWEVPVWNVTPENFIRVREASLRGCRGEFVREELLLYAAAAGKEAVTIDFSIKPVRDPNGQIVFLLAEGRNITERKAAEAEIERKNTELAQLAMRLQELDRLKTEFFSNVSHELRTPLSLILGPVQKILASGGASEDEKKDLVVVERNARLLLKHVNDLLDISRLEAGAMTLKYGNCDLAWLGRFVASFFEFITESKQLTFSVQMPETLPAQFDVAKLERVLLNLLSNAFKFTPVGGTITFSIEQQGDAALISVRDTGPGIPDQMIPAVFERFRQLEGSSSRRFGGTGLGLSIVKEFVELHHGEVSISNETPNGLGVQIVLPLVAPEGTEVSETSEEAAALGKTYAEELGYQDVSVRSVETEDNGAAPLVLVVEDNDDVRDFLHQILLPQYRTVLARNGQEGLQKAIKSQPSLIIADVMMPLMSGEEMVRELRKEPAGSAIPIIMLTARAEDELRVRMLREGIQDFVTKPFHAKELLARVERIIEERKKAAVTLKLSEQRYRTLVEATTSVVWTTNPLGEIDSPQDAWEYFTGQKPEESAGLGWINAFHPDDREIIRIKWQAAIKSPKLFEVEGRIWNKATGMYRFVIGRGISLKNFDGSVREWVVTIFDMHDRVTMEQRLRTSVAEKDTLLKEMHHRVKNNMQVISSLLRLQAKSVEEKRLQAILEESQSRIRAMALVHEKLYQSPTLSRIDFADYLTLLVRELFSSLSFSNRARISLQLDIEPVDLDISRAIPCGLLINELLSNCLKHAFPEGTEGVISVTLKAVEGGRVLLALGDNGVGLPPEVQLERPNSLGLQIVKTLASQIGGKLVCERKDGTHWSIQFDKISAEELRTNAELSQTRTDQPARQPLP